MVREHLNLHRRSARPVAQIAVSERIDNSFANRRDGILFCILAIEPLDDGSTLHVAPEDVERRAEHVGNRAFDAHVVQEPLLAWSGLAHLSGWIDHERETQRREESLRIFAKS